MLLNVMHTQTLEMLGHEWAARQKAIEEDPREAVDRISRSAALLQNAYLLSYTEALDAVSALVFGAEAGILPVRRPEELAPLHLDLLPYRLRRRFGGTDVSHRLRAARATVARAAIREAGPPSRPRTAESSDKT
jgi:protein-arginine kinase